MSRGADQSFNGLGLPAIFGDLSEPVPTPVGAHCWWWHTPDDLPTISTRATLCATRGSTCMRCGGC